MFKRIRLVKRRPEDKRGRRDGPADLSSSSSSSSSPLLLAGLITDAQGALGGESNRVIQRSAPCTYIHPSHVIVGAIITLTEKGDGQTEGIVRRILPPLISSREGGYYTSSIVISQADGEGRILLASEREKPRGAH